MALTAARERHVALEGEPVAPTAASKALAELDDLGKTMQRLLDECKESAASRLRHNGALRAVRQRKSDSPATETLHESVLTASDLALCVQLPISMLYIAILETSTSSRLRLSFCPRRTRLCTAVRPGNFAISMCSG